MKRITLLLILTLALCAFPALAQDGSTSTVAFNGFSFSLPSALASNVNITQNPGDPTTVEQPGGPEVKHTQFLLYNNTPAPESFLDGVGGIRVYATADFSGYTMAQQEYQNLQTILAQRPDLSQYMVADQGTNAMNLPYLPTFPAAQIIRAQATYVDTPYIQGIRYVTAYRQDVSPFVGSEFLYAFQGISADGGHYISATFRVNTTLFPPEIPPDFDMDTFNQQFTEYLTQSIATLNGAAPNDFTPSLTTLDSVVQSFAFPAAPQLPATALPPAPAITPTPTVGDATMGGLASFTWTLTSYGDPANPQPVVEGTSVTLTFSQGGIGGSAGCNTYSGAFQFEGTSLAVSQVIRTLMACADPAVMAQEDAYLNALGTAASFQLSGSQLTISYDGGVLTFTGA
ncbi:MAG: META domain-containing protein [Anaerolineae bacterium]